MKQSIRKVVSCQAVRCKSSRGMTFFELLVTMSIVAILLTLAVPAFDTLLQTNRLATLSNTYLTNLHMARSEAITRNARVALCKSTDGATCSTSGNWGQGWLVFHDMNNNAQVDEGEIILRVHEAIASNWILKGNAPVANYVSYAGMGDARLTNGAFQAGTLTLCRESAGGGEARHIVISATGRPRVEAIDIEACN